MKQVNTQVSAKNTMSAKSSQEIPFLYLSRGLIRAGMAVLFGLSVSQAAQKTKKVANSPIKSPSATTMSMAASAASTTTATVPATGANSVTTATAQMSELKPESARKISASLIAAYDAPALSLNTNNRVDVEGAYVFKLNYKMSAETSVFVRPYFVYHHQADETKSSGEFGDFVVGATNSSKNFLGVFSVGKYEHRLYLPTSNASKNSEKLLRYRGLYGFPFAITKKLEVSYNFWPDYNVYRTNDSRLGLSQYGEVSYEIIPGLALYQDIGSGHALQISGKPNAAKEEAWTSSSWELATGLYWSQIKEFNLLLQAADSTGNLGAGRIYNNEGTKYSLWAIINI